MQRHDIFVSYNRHDSETAESIVAFLRSYGFSVWYDQDLPLGEAYASETLQRARNARCLLLVWSQAAAASWWVKAEYLTGADNVLAVFLDATALPTEIAHRNAGQVQTPFDFRAAYAERIRAAVFEKLRREHVQQELRADRSLYSRWQIDPAGESEKVRMAIRNAESGDRGSALYNLGRAYASRNHGYGQNLNGAAKLLITAALYGHIDAKWWASKVLLTLNQREDEFETAYRLLEDAAHAGCVEAQFDYGCALLNLDQRQEALRWLEAAAGERHVSARALAGAVLLDGANATEAEKQRGREHLQLAMAGGDPHAALRLAKEINASASGAALAEETLMVFARERSQYGDAAYMQAVQRLQQLK